MPQWTPKQVADRSRRDEATDVVELLEVALDEAVARASGVQLRQRTVQRAIAEIKRLRL